MADGPRGDAGLLDDFDRMKAEELADLARWEAQARQLERRLTSGLDCQGYGSSGRARR